MRRQSMAVDLAVAALLAAAIGITGAMWPMKVRGAPSDDVSCVTLAEEEAEAMAAQFAGLPVSGYTFHHPVIERLFDAIQRAQHGDAEAPLPPPAPGTARVEHDKTSAVMVLHYAGRDQVLLLFYGADGCRFADGLLPVETFERGMEIGGFNAPPSTSL